VFRLSVSHHQAVCKKVKEMNLYNCGLVIRSLMMAYWKPKHLLVAGVYTAKLQAVFVGYKSWLYYNEKGWITLRNRDTFCVKRFVYNSSIFPYFVTVNLQESTVRPMMYALINYMSLSRIGNCLRSAVFCDITRHREVILYRRCGTTYRSHLQGLRSPLIFGFLDPCRWDRYVVPKRR
jgi:hypothetical protein